MKLLRTIIALALRIPSIMLLFLAWVLWSISMVVEGNDASLDYIAYTNHIEEKYNLPQNLLVAICSYENRSHLWKNVAGQHGEIGVCQIKPDTVRMVCGNDCSSEDSNIVFGSVGDKVRLIQSKVGVTVDGIFGPVTLEAVLKYQNYHHLRADGVVGAKTWFAMTGKALTNQSIAEQLWEPKKNIEYAAKYIVWLRNLLGNDESLIIAAYNAGPASPVVVYAQKVNAIRASYETK